MASGILCALAFPKANLWWLAWIGLAPMFILLERSGRQGWAAFRIGWLAGFAFFCTLLYWIVPTFKAAGLPVLGGVGAVALLSGYLAVFWGAFFSLLTRPGFSRLAGLARPFAAGALWVGLEFLRAHLFSGFPWGLMGYSQWKALPVIQVADLIGVYGVSFLLLVFNAALARAWLLFCQPRPLGGISVGKEFPPCGVTGSEATTRGAKPLMGRRRGLRSAAARAWLQRAWSPLLAPGVVVAAALVYGVVRIEAVGSITGSSLKVAVLQGNIAQYAKWDRAYQEHIMAEYRRLADTAAVSRPGLIIWPETALPGMLENPAFGRSVTTLVRATGTWNLIGVNARATEPGKLRNRAALFRPDGTITAAYDKVHLVPFGEVVPFHAVLGRWIGVLNALGDFTPGPRNEPLVVGPDPGAVRAGVTICYEATFPHVAREVAARGAGVLVNLTNDGWYLDTAAPEQHFSMNVFRAVENRLPVVRAANTGISAVIDPTGRVTRSLGLMEAGVLEAEVAPSSQRAVYTRLGDAFSWFCGVGAVGTLFVRHSRVGGNPVGV